MIIVIIVLKAWTESGTTCAKILKNLTLIDWFNIN
jgi:hypothetical protein